MKMEIKTMGKMRIKFIVLLMILVSGNGYGQHFLKHLKTYYAESQENNAEIISLSDGNLLIGTSSKSDSTYFKSQNSKGGYDYWIIKIDSNGNKIWDKTFGGSMDDNLTFLFETRDKSYLLCGTSSSSKSFDKTDTFYGSTYGGNCWLVKIDSNGNKLWDKTYGSNALDYIGGIIENNDGSFVIGAHSWGGATNVTKTASTKGNADYWVIKIDSLGNRIWDKSIGSQYGEMFSTIVKYKKGFLLGGSSGQALSGDKTVFGFGEDDIWLVYIDTNANVIWDKVFGGLLDESKGWSNYFESVNIAIDNDDIYLASTSNSSSSGNIISKNKGGFDYLVLKIDSLGNKIWDRLIGGENNDFARSILIKDSFIFISGTSNSNLNKETSRNNSTDYWIIKLDKSGNLILEKTIGGNKDELCPIITIANSSIYILGISESNKSNEKPDTSYVSDMWLVKLDVNFNYKKIKGSILPDFNSNCLYNKPSEYNIPNLLIQNKVENTYAFTNDSIYSIYLFDRDTAILKIINLDSNLYVSCGKDSIIVDMTGKTDTSGIDFPIRSNKTGSCVKINSFSHSILRPGFWGTYQLNYQNTAFDTAFSAYIDVEIDTAKIDSISSPYSYTLTGNILRFQIGNVRPFGNSSITYNIKLKTSVIIGSSICHRASIFPNCNVFQYPSNDSSVIEVQMRCKSNDTVEVQLKNIGTKNQHDWGIVKSYEDVIILKTDTFKLNSGDIIKFKYKLDTNKVYTAEIFNNNNDPIHPVLIRHDDICTNKKPLIQNNPVLMFNRHDEAREYEEDCDVVRGSYDPNIKSVIPIGLFSEHYTATGTELKYRIDFQNTGTDTAFRVVLIDTLNDLLNMASFVPGISSHSYSVEFGGRAVKFIFDPIKLVDSFHNEPASHGFVTFKIKHNQGITPKSKIENKADIYFDYNAPVRTNTVFNTIFDTIQIYVPKGGSSILGINDMTTLIYPNPASEKVIISMSEPIKDLKIELYDMQGKLVSEFQSNNKNTAELNVLNLQKGLYILRCMSGDKLIVMKKIEIN